MVCSVCSVWRHCVWREHEGMKVKFDKAAPECYSDNRRFKDVIPSLHVTLAFIHSIDATRLGPVMRAQMGGGGFDPALHNQSFFSTCTSG